VRQRAVEEMKHTARLAKALGVDTVVGFIGSSIWQSVAMFPPVPQTVIDAQLPGLRRPLRPRIHPSEIAYDDWTTLRTLDAVGH
jgi:hypothetical protein